MTALAYQMWVAVTVLILTAGCAKSAHQTGQDMLDRVIPSDIRAQVDETASFSDLSSFPDSYIGRTVMVSGLAMKSQRVKDHTEIEVMQIPTATGMTPSDRRSQSEGRFIATKSGAFFDPAIIEIGSPVTVVGEMKGTTTRTLDEGEYVYPILEIKHLVDWNEVRSREERYPSSYRYGGYGGYGYGGYGYGLYSPWYYGFASPFYGPYGMYPYAYYGPYFVPHGVGGFGSGGSAPSAPPPASVPPQFKKNR
jgi:outer membrane lipoprotein